MHNRVAPRISDSFLIQRSPWDHVFRDLSLVLSIGGEVIVVLIDDGDTLRFPLGIPSDIEEYGDMFLRGIRESIVRLAIETGNHESLIR